MGERRSTARHRAAIPFGWHEPVLPPTGHRRSGRDRHSLAAGGPAGRPGIGSVGAPVGDPGRGGRHRRAHGHAERGTATRAAGADRAQPQLRVRRRPGERRAGHRPRAVRHRARPSTACSATGRAQGSAGAPPAGRPRRPHRPRHRALRRHGSADRRWRRHRGARLPRAALRRGRPDLGAGRADRARLALRRRREPAPVAPRRRGVAAHQDARPQGRHGPGQGAARALHRSRAAHRAGRSAPIHPGSRRWKPPSPTRRRSTSCGRRPR